MNELQPELKNSSDFWRPKKIAFQSKSSIPDGNITMIAIVIMRQREKIYFGKTRSFIPDLHVVFRNRIGRRPRLSGHDRRDGNRRQ